MAASLSNSAEVRNGYVTDVQRHFRGFCHSENVFFCEAMVETCSQICHRIFEEECVADGYSMPAGCIKVALENGSVKYVSCPSGETFAKRLQDYKKKTSQNHQKT